MDHKTGEVPFWAPPAMRLDHRLNAGSANDE